MLLRQHLSRVDQRAIDQFPDVGMPTIEDVDEPGKGAGGPGKVIKRALKDKSKGRGVTAIKDKEDKEASKPVPVLQLPSRTGMPIIRPRAGTPADPPRASPTPVLQLPSRTGIPILRRPDVPMVDPPRVSRATREVVVSHDKRPLAIEDAPAKRRNTREHACATVALSDRDITS